MKNKAFKLFLIGETLLAHILLFFIAFNSDFIARIEYKFKVKLLPISETIMTEHYYLMLKFHERIDATVEPNSVIFFGDSLVQGLHTAAIAPVSVNYGVGSDTTSGLHKRLPLYQSIIEAKVIVIAIGVNDVRYGLSKEKILENYQQILQDLPADVPILMSGILPVDENINPDWRGFNQKISEINSALEAYADSENIFFMDITEQLIDSENNLANEFHDDGLHLNGAGNQVWLDELESILKQF